MSRQSMVIGALVIVLLIGGGLFLANKNTSPAPATSAQPEVNTQVITPSAKNSVTPEVSSPAESAAPTGAVKEVTIEGSNFKFVPNTLSVNKGDTVKVTFKNSGGMHNVKFDDFSAGSKTIQSGASDTFQFAADKTGTFQYYCSVDGHRSMGMVGTLTVK